MSPLAQLLDHSILRRMADPASYERGVEYAASGRVLRVTRNEMSLEASVEGTRRYRVELWEEDGDLKATCDCPMGARGVFCKHCVATGLAALEAGDEASASISSDDIRHHLASLKKAELIDLLLEEAGEDERLLDRLRLRTVTAGGLDMAAFRDAIDRAVDPGNFIGYAEARDYSRGLDETIGSLRTVLTTGHPTEAVELIEHCCFAIERAGGRIDDSDGHLTIAFSSLQRLHREACERAGLDPVQLAERLFSLMMATEYELFYDAAESYAPLLGDRGRKRYTELVRIEWERLPEMGPGDDRYEMRSTPFLAGDGEMSERSARFRITYVMELIARQSGDPDEIATVLSHDLSMPYSFLRIAEVYADAGRDDDAIAWAERGVAAFSGHRDARLVAFLAAAHRRRGEHDRAAELMWDVFEANPGLDSYRELKPYSVDAGAWAETQGRAHALLRDRISSARDNHQARGIGWALVDATQLVRIHLWEGDPASALTVARENGCRQDTWLVLADALEEDEPGEAATIYREQIEPTIERKTKADYRQAAEMLGRIRDLMERTGEAAEFPIYLEQVRETHKRKRNLMKLLAGLDNDQ